MSGDDGRARRSDYRTARIGAAAAFASCLIIVVLFEIVVHDDPPDTALVGILAGLVVTLLGLEVRSIVGTDK